MSATFRFLLVFLTLISVCSASENFSYPGGVAQIIVAKKSDQIPDVKFGLNEPVIMEYPDHWRILIGLSINTLPGEYVSYIKPGPKGSPGQYEKLIVKQHVYPFNEYSKSDTRFADHAIVQTHASYSSIEFSNTQQPTLPLRWPAEGTWSDNFGHKLYDKKTASLHVPNALVYSSEKLTTVIAPQSAIISKIEVSTSGQKAVFLDHGRGLYSILTGLSDVTVEVGNGILAGAVIGKLQAKNNDSKNSSSDKTLIWQTVLNSTYVDPQVLTKLKP
jgi:hypothetical protein